jgi:hypothetical protein
LGGWAKNTAAAYQKEAATYIRAVMPNQEMTRALLEKNGRRPIAAGAGQRPREDFGFLVRLGDGLRTDAFFCGCTAFCVCTRVPELDGLSKLAGRVSLLPLRLFELVVDSLLRLRLSVRWLCPLLELNSPRLEAVPDELFLDELGWVGAPRCAWVSGLVFIATFAWSASTRLELEVAFPSMEAWASWLPGVWFCGLAGR